MAFLSSAILINGGTAGALSTYKVLAKLSKNTVVSSAISSCVYHRQSGCTPVHHSISELHKSSIAKDSRSNCLFVPPQFFTPRTHIQTLVSCQSKFNYNHGNSSREILSLHKQTSLLHNSHRQFSLNTRTILQSSPLFLQPYLRLIRFDRPIGSFLLFWPCTWSIGLSASAGQLPDLYILALFGAGSFFMRGAGCIINDMWDTDIDKKVDRTKLRPLASGELSQFQALCCLGVNLSISLAILLQLNNLSIVLGASSMILVILYPLAKRFTNWPQIILGLTLNWGVLLAWSQLNGALQWPLLPLYVACLTFNYGALLGWCAVQGTLDWPILPLYTSCLLWTIIYDTIYAHQDKYDDMLIGVKSTALTLGDKTKPWLAGFSVVMVSSLALTGVLCDQTWPYYTALSATAAHLAYQLFTVDLNDPDDCFAKFKSNSRLGLVLFLGIVTGTLLKPKENSEKSNETGNQIE